MKYLEQHSGPQIMRLKEENTYLRDEATLLQDHLSKANYQNFSLKKQNKSLQEELVEVNTKWENSKTELESQMRDHKLLKDQAAQDKRSLKLAKEHVQSLETQLDQFKEKVKRLNEIALKHGGKVEVTESAMHHT